MLLVDDSALVRQRWSALLAEARALELYEAGSAAQARRMLDAAAFEVAVIDVHLGRESGLDLIREIRERGTDALVIMVTNDATRAHERACFERGADFFFDKSKDFERVAELVVDCARHGVGAARAGRNP